MHSTRKLLAVSTAFLGMVFGAPLQAATISVTATTDAFDGGVCTLRNAVQSINTGADFGACLDGSADGYGVNDTILLAAETYVLTIDGSDEDDNETGDLDVSVPLTLQGAGSDQTTIDASGIPSGDRALQLVDAGPGTLRGFAVTGGDTIGIGQEGGGIFAIEMDIQLEDIRIFGNQANVGGGMYFEGQGLSMTVQDSTIDGNNALFCGGGLYIEFNSTVGISHSAITRNEVDDGDGGGDGGGICDSGNYLFLTNTTVSSNTAVEGGGGIYSLGGLKGAYNVTVAFNQATADDSFGGGMVNERFQGDGGDDRFDPEIFNTLVAQNTAARGPDCFGDFLSGGFNLIGNIGESACTNFADGVNGDQVGSPAAPLDPVIGGLANNGGSTETNALLLGSPAIDQGNSAGCEALDVPNFIENDTLVFAELTDDQRHLTRPVAILDPMVPVCDIGAYEFQIPEPTPTPTPTATATPIPPFNALLEGSGCSLTALGSASASGLASIGLMALWGGLAHWALRRRKH